MSDQRLFFKQNKKTSNFTKNNHSLSNEPNIALDDIFLSNEDINSLQEACLDDPTKIINYFEPKLQENQIALEHQVKAIERIAEESKKLSDSSIQIADSAKSQAESAKFQSKLAKQQAEKADWISLIALFVSIFALLLEIIVNRVELCSFIWSLIP